MADAIVRTLHRAQGLDDPESEIFNLGGSDTTQLNDFISGIAEGLRKSADWVTDYYADRPVLEV